MTKIRPIVFLVNDSPVDLWVDLPNEYIVLGNLIRNISVNLTGMPQTSDKGFFTILLEAKINAGSGAARIIIENSEHSTPQSWAPADVYGFWDHVQFSNYGAFFATEDIVDKTWTTNQDASQYINIINNRGVFSTLWPRNTYSQFKLVCDRSNKICYVYIDGILHGYVSNFSNDLLTWNMIYLYSDTGGSSEIAAVKNIKVAGFNTLEDAQSWNGN